MKKIILALSVSTQLFSQAIRWEIGTQLPQLSAQQYGLAGAIIGVNNRTMIIAGGANFGEKMPWNGGKKGYFNDIYVLTPNENWRVFPEKFPQKIAYSAITSTKKGIVSIGGENQNGLSNEAFLLNWHEKENAVSVRNLPNIPEKITNGMATSIGNTIYVLGGENTEKTLASFYRLNISTKNSTWEKLPDLPVAVSHAVVMSQGNHIFLFGGRAKVPQQVSQLYKHSFVFDIVANQWKKLADIGGNDFQLSALSAGTGVVLKKNKLLLIGGDKGNVFSSIEKYNLAIEAASTENDKQQLINEKKTLLENHQGFSRDLLLYDIKRNMWKKIGQIPMLTPVTTTALMWNKKIYIVSGEIKPGVRSTNILIGKFQ